MNIKISGWLVGVLSVLLLAGLVIILMAAISESAELDRKIDTIGVDTVGFHKDSTGAGYYSSNLYGDSITWTPVYTWVPTLHYTTDTTYRLNRVQVEWLGHMDNPVVCTSLACGYKDIHIGRCKKITPYQGK